MADTKIIPANVWRKRALPRCVVGNASSWSGRVTYVKENDFSVFLCRLETAMRAASCGG